MTPRELRAARAVGAARRTYLCLEGMPRKPTDYEITSTALLYYPARGLEVDTPVGRHCLERQHAGQLQGDRWDTFEDPARLTYSAYVAERRDQEAFLDRLLERPFQPVGKGLRPLIGFLSALRFPLHGLQMVAAYVGAMAPSGRICIAAAFQAADELRAIQRLCQWLSRSGTPVAELDVLGREIWQQSPAFQPLRRLLEELLVTYDWGQALIALNGLVKPVFDRLWFDQVASLAERHHDEVLEKISGSLSDDARWHEAWFVDFAKLALESEATNAEVLRRHVERYRPQVAQAAQALLPAFGGLLGDDGARAYAWRELDAALNLHLHRVGAASARTVEVGDESRP